MISLKIIKLVLLFAIFTTCVFTQDFINGKAIEIKDGKTFILENDKGKYLIELQYVEIPSDKDFSKIVKEHLEKLILGKNVDFYLKEVKENKNIGKVIVNEIDISLQLIRDGAAWCVFLHILLKESDERIEYIKTESIATQERRGLWGNELLKPNRQDYPASIITEDNRIILPMPSLNGESESTSGTGENSKNKIVQVKGYTRKDGTYVKPHTRSAPTKKP